MNKVILMGRLTSDPTLSQTPSGIATARFAIAVNRRFAKEGQQQVDFINCTAWRQQAEFVCRYFKKGSMIAVVGSIQTRSWDGQDGKKQYATDVVADEVYFTGSKAETGTGSTKPVRHTADTFDSGDMQTYPNDDFTELGAEDDLPF